MSSQSGQVVRVRRAETPLFEVCAGFGPDAERGRGIFSARDDGTLLVRGRRRDYAIRATNLRGEFEVLGRGHCCVVSRVRSIAFEDAAVAV